MEIIIRLEKEKDYRNVEYMTREAFWDVYKPGCVEHLMVHNLRKVPAYIKELSFVACDNDVVVGNIMYSVGKVINNEREFEVLTMGPLGVLPTYQKQGIGSMLMKYSIVEAIQLGYKCIIIYCNPQFYHRFGFINAKEYGIQTRTGDNFEPFMVLELFEGALAGISGRYYEDAVFDVDQKELEMFEKEFPYKEKHVTDTQFK